MREGLYEVQLVNQHGVPFREEEIDDKSYTHASPGQEFTVKITVHRHPVSGHFPYDCLRVGLFVDGYDVQYWKRMDFTLTPSHLDSVSAVFVGFKKNTADLRAFVFSAPAGATAEEERDPLFKEAVSKRPLGEIKVSRERKEEGERKREAIKAERGIERLLRARRVINPSSPFPQFGPVSSHPLFPSPFPCSSPPPLTPTRPSHRHSHRLRQVIIHEAEAVPNAAIFENKVPPCACPSAIYALRCCPLSHALYFPPPLLLLSSLIPLPLAVTL